MGRGILKIFLSPKHAKRFGPILSEYLRYFEKLTNYFVSNYTNSPKFNSSYVSYLRVFFERNNKIRTTFASLGNVFRNSKWSDLKVQNIKTSLITNWLSFTFVLVSALVLLLSFFGVSTLSSYILGWSFVSDILDTARYLWVQLVHTVSLAWVQLWLTSVACKITLTNYLNFNKSQLNAQSNYFASSPTVDTLTSPKLSTRGVLASAPSTSSANLTEVCYYLSRTMSSIASVSADARPLYTPKANSPILNDIRTLLPQVVEGYSSRTSNWGPTSLGQSSISYILMPNTITDWAGTPAGYAAGLHKLSNLKTYTLDLNTIQRAGSFHTTATLSNFNIYTNLGQSKQDRWLLRNSLLANSSSVDANAYTQTKKLLGTAVLDSKSTSSNIWSSAKMSTLSHYSELSHLSSMQGLTAGFSGTVSGNISQLLTTLPSDFDSLNFFESSRMWTTKKYFFLNQLQSNTVRVDTAPRSVTTQVSNNSLHTLNVFTSLNNQDVSVQLKALLVSGLGGSNISGVKSSSLLAGTNYTALGDADLLKSLNLCILDKVTSSALQQGLGTFTLTPLNTKLSLPSRKQKSL